MKSRVCAVVMSLVVVGTAVAASPARAEIAVIVNPANQAATLDADTVSKIFLGKSAQFPSGAKAEPADLAEGAATRDEFYRKVVAKDAAQLKAYWSKLIFSGKGVPPKALASDDEIKAWVAKNQTAIAYIDAKHVDGNVKVVLSIP